MILDSKFRPSWWLSNPHLQTLWASKARKPKIPTTFSQRLELPDGDFLDINWSESIPKSALEKLQTAVTDGVPSTAPPTSATPSPTSRDLILIFHGLAGSINSSYAASIINVLEKTGFSCLFMHFRSCSGEPNRLAESYHSGHTKDIRLLINNVHNCFPDTRLHAVGYSLGANALLKYLGEERQTTPLKSAVAVSPPMVLQEGAKRMNKGASKIYQRHLLNAMKAQLEIKRERYPTLNLPDNTENLDTFWDFDDKVTAYLGGFDCVDDYYSKSSSRQFLQHITIPTTIIHAIDDPFFSTAMIPDADELSASVTLELSKRGGHVGFVTGANPLKPGYWLDQRIPELLASLETSDGAQGPTTVV